jgi:hypothetical protein
MKSVPLRMNLERIVPRYEVSIFTVRAGLVWRVAAAVIQIDEDENEFARSSCICSAQ